MIRHGEEVVLFQDTVNPLIAHVSFLRYAHGQVFLDRIDAIPSASPLRERERETGDPPPPPPVNVVPTLRFTLSSHIITALRDRIKLNSGSSQCHHSLKFHSLR
jgi:hypothetical protein